ncbi:hypothetical protein GJ496_003470 [Pomphorhynchus laevis]|nr:hypothetical protein GJ496_003470 [Pomphorhynchus laevis]
MSLSRGPGFASMLKDGAKHMEGIDDVVYRNIDACIELSKLTNSSFGPCGLTKFVINHLNKLYTTSDAAAIIHELEVQHPAAKLLSMASEQQDREVGDGTNLVILLGSAFLSRASTNLLRMGLTPCQIQQGYDIAMQKCMCILESIANKYQINDLLNANEVSDYLRPVIASKYIGCDEFLAPLVAQACVETIKQSSSVSPTNFNVDNVRICKIKGGSVFSSFKVQGLVLKSDVESQCRSISQKDSQNPVKVAVYSCPFDISTLETKGTVLLHNAAELLSFSRGEESGLRSEIEAIHNAGIQVIVSGSKFSDLALHYLNQFNMLAIKVTSKFELRRIARSCNAFVHPKVQVPNTHEIGLCQKVYCDEIGQTQVVRIDSIDSKVTTVVLRASTEQILDDLERAVNDAINVYKAFTKDNRLVPGGCATELELAQQLTKFASMEEDAFAVVNGGSGDGQDTSIVSSDSLERYAIQAFGEAFELPVRMLIDNSGLNGTEMLAKLYGMHADGLNENIGIVLPSGRLQNVVEAKIMDSYIVKMWSIKLAYQAVSSILSVDQIIMAKPAGGPKPKQNQHWDED